MNPDGLPAPAGDVRQQLARTLAARAALFVLDNARHVRDELADLVDHLLDHTTAPRFLMTSRVPLDLPDERRIPVEPLGSAELTAPAVELFRCAAERFGAAVASGDGATARRICEQLDGLPQRHASLRSVLENTWALLDARDSELLRRLAALPGPFDLVDVEQCGADLAPGEAAGLIVRLIDHSLVVPADTNRFTLPESVRLYANREVGRARSRRAGQQPRLREVGHSDHVGRRRRELRPHAGDADRAAGERDARSGQRHQIGHRVECASLGRAHQLQ